MEQVCQDRFMGLERGRGLMGGGRQQRIAATNSEGQFSLFDHPDIDPNATIASTSPPALSNPTGGSNSQAQLAAQVAQLTSLLSGLSSVVNQPQGF